MTEPLPADPAADAPAAEERRPPPKSQSRVVWERTIASTGAKIGLALIGLFFGVAALAPFLAQRFPLVWRSADGGLTFPLLREFFAPGETTEPLLEIFFNFMLLFLPLAWALLRLLPRWERFAAAWVTVLLWGGIAGGLGGGAAWLLWSLPLAPGTAAWWVRLVAAVGIGAGLLALAVAGAREIRTSPRWLLVAALGLLLALPFALGRPVNDPTAYRDLAAAGEGSGLFPLYRYGPNETVFSPKTPPAFPAAPLLGADNSGRDVLARLVHGARVSLAVGFVAVGIAVMIGLLVGSSAGYFGGWADIVLSRGIEVMICFPAFFLILTIIAILEKRSILNIMLVIGLTGWTGTARLIRGEVLKQRKLDYAQSARALGAGAIRIIVRHILPNAIGPVLVSVSFGIAGAILVEASLSFIGFGVQPPTPTWGELLQQGRDTPLYSWWLVVFPGLMVFLGVFAYNLVGEALRDALDPRLRS
jgi:peptide/nickel transport system permease protein